MLIKHGAGEDEVSVEGLVHQHHLAILLQL